MFPLLRDPRAPFRPAWLVGLMGALVLPSIAQAQASSIRLSDLPPQTAVVRSKALRSEPVALMLATHLNTRDFGLQPAQLANSRLHMRRSALQTLGLKNDALPSHSGPAGQDEWIALDEIPGMKVELNMGLQTVTLALPFEQLNWAATEIHAQEMTSGPSQAALGMLLNYDLYGLNTRDSRSLSATTEWRAFMADMVLSNTMLSQFASQDASRIAAGDQESNSRQVRLDTAFSYSLPQSMVTLRVGDTLTKAQPWSRSTRIGGIQIGRNFALQPYRITSPMPALMGTSALPSEIELFINGIKQYQGSVNAGPFSLNTPTGITGTGNAQVVLTDAMGRSTTLQYSLYGTTQLLAKGLTDWSAELGWVRRNYGYRSFDYASDPVASGSWSHGMSNRLTLQSHAEVSKDLVNLGGGASWQAGSLGIVSAATAISQQQGQTGNLLQLGHNWNDQRFFTSFQATRANASYRDAASLYDLQRQKASGRAIVGYAHPQYGSVSFGYLHLQNFGESAQRYVSAGWSRNLGGRGSIGISANHNLDDSRKSSVQLVASWFLDGRINTGATVGRQNGESVYSAYASQSRPSEGGWGWSTLAQGGDGGSNAQARVEYQARKFEANAAVATQHGDTSTALGLSGSLIAMGGHVFAARRVYDGFAVVSTNGVPNVPINHENNPIGSTDADGVMLVTQLGAYRNNRISIDPLALSAQYRLPASDKIVIPSDRAGTLVKFDIERIRSASIVLHDTQGEPLPLGSRATLGEGAGSASSVVGYDGTAYFEQIKERNLIEVHMPDGTHCRAAADWPAATAANLIPVIGPLVCQ